MSAGGDWGTAEAVENKLVDFDVGVAMLALPVLALGVEESHQPGSGRIPRRRIARWFGELR
jgi:hypothetical protein